ncbi:PAS domain-containing sensor histidine kinase [Frigoribacterium sp. CG_9.8]|uniref:hybrid sensor histidine kinase/response regulator n=1 Tax=Frigoribacterium sp. CG_9.8 TaxID=2787733 RepID=UPI0018C9FB96|nr:PAS domain-containing sensor histidine kinase [Frigoribacterium sp. CG_9.8]MBG6107721.1 PAS domain S-box-containing protein [Frigoribacterium sp. CG_9.8]
MEPEIQRSGEEIRRLLGGGGFDAIFAANTEAMFVCATDGSFIDGNSAMLANSGYSRAELELFQFGYWVHPEDRQLADAQFAAAVAGETQQYISSGGPRDGSTVRNSITLIPFMHDGRTIAVVGVTTDITRLRSMVTTDLNRSSSSEARFAAVLGSISDALLCVDREYRATYLNPRAEQLGQVHASKLLGQVIWDVFPEILGSEFSIALARAISEQRTTVVRGYYTRLKIWVEATAYPIDEGLAIYFRDVSESESTRQELASQMAQLAEQSALLDIARDAILVRNLDSKIRYWNAAASRIYGWSREEVIGSLARVVMFADPAPFDRALEATVRDGHWSGEFQNLTKSGAEITVGSHWTLVRDSEGRPESIFSVHTDVTERRRSEQRDLRAQRLESLGTLASGIAHDLNNVLTPILMAVQLLVPGESDTRRREILQSTELATKRGADMIRQVLSFASGANIHRVPVDMKDVIDELESLSAKTLPENVSAMFTVDADLWQTSGNATQLLRVLMNLVANAEDAMPDGGTLDIRARNFTLTDVYSSANNFAAPGDYVMVEVQDSGSGIAHSVLDKIFEPFFTTKPTGAGTGLGLSTSLAIIRGHNGAMQVCSEPGHGTVLRLRLPATGKRGNTANANVRVEEHPRGAGELILVVDDEAAIRNLTCRTLDTYGYITAIASNGAEAIEYLDSQTSAVALVLTDMAMPVMDGATTARYLHEHHPDVPVIATSGLTTIGGVDRARSSGIHAFLAKPFTTAELLCAINDALHPERAHER